MKKIWVILAMVLYACGTENSDRRSVPEDDEPTESMFITFPVPVPDVPPVVDDGETEVPPVIIVDDDADEHDEDREECARRWVKHYKKQNHNKRVRVCWSEKSSHGRHKTYHCFGN